MKEYKLSGGEALARAVEKRYETVASEYHFEPLNLHDGGLGVSFRAPEPP